MGKASTSEQSLTCLMTNNNLAACLREGMSLDVGVVVSLPWGVAVWQYGGGSLGGKVLGSETSSSVSCGSQRQERMEQKQRDKLRRPSDPGGERQPQFDHGIVTDKPW